MSITRLSDVKEDNRLITPADLLDAVAEEIRAGEITPTKLVILHLNDEEDNYTTGFRAANISICEMAGLMEVIKHDLLNQR